MTNETKTRNAADWVPADVNPMSKLDPQEQQCPDHGPYMANGYKLRTREVWDNCPICERQRREQMEFEQRERDARRRQERMEERLGQCLIPRRFLDRSLDNFIADTPDKRKALEVVRDYLDNFKANRESGRGLILAGKPGTGKSHLATAVLRAILGDYFGLYVTCPDYIRAIRGTWHKGAEKSEEQVLDDYASVSLLVLDEVGVAFGTDGEQKHLFDLLDRRYREQRPTIILTNEDAEGLKRYVGERVFDRLTETCKWVPFNWASYRRTAAKGGA